MKPASKGKEKSAQPSAASSLSKPAPKRSASAPKAASKKGGIAGSKRVASRPASKMLPKAKDAGASIPSKAAPSKKSKKK